ncbi:acyl-CoA carboxylase subunit epsilon [Amycolatopsis suaedae]|uniref:Acyl-CoA carboxylase subunit epsilon n=1 Tax=Amycolatopsis suaedae TaxID=2510978 RepID=A0A4Q7J5A7_9PSEU|nr:acyl-CoA carboxylase subunit epsilon [Amycolatopsis suaedae]RZQ62760.1 acyl-CoA carboxylase subunit epsilon [Amycolatopsis suaedae]
MSGEEQPLLRVVRGNPDDVELAALTAVVAAAAAGEASAANGPARPRPTSRWADRAANLRQPPHPGPGAWRASALPR